MTLRFLADTNVISEPTKKSPNPAVLENLKQYDGQVATASVVWHELWYGCQRLPASRKRQQIEHYLINVIQISVPLLAYDAESAKWHAVERARLSHRGQVPPFIDGQIAAIAHRHNLILVTRNVTDFALFSDLQMENWYDDRP